MSEGSGTRHIVLMNEMGDIEIAWDKEHDEAMRAVIEKKMQEGVRFFIIKPILHSSFHRRTRLTNLKELKEQKVKIEDDSLEQLFAAGKIELTRVASDAYDSGPVASTAQEVIAARSAVGVRPLKGG